MVEKLVTGKNVWRKRDQGPLCREGALLMLCGAFAVAFLWMFIRIKSPIIQLPFPEVHNDTTKINGLTLEQPFFEHVGLCKKIHSR